MTQKEEVVFILGDKLPTYYDIAISLFQVCSSRQGEKAQSTLNAFYSALVNSWGKAFGEGHVQNSPTIMKKLQKLRDSYSTEVCGVQSKGSKKA